ncbi:MAG: MarR family transcriptional regulator [bacterium]|nr:MarR family transcriptional regulator [bacterium]
MLIEGLRILADNTNDEGIRGSYDKLKFDDDDKRVIDLSLDAFRVFHTENNCGILFMVENVNRVIENQIKQRPEIHLLRKILIEEEWIVFMGTSPTFLNAVTKPEEPLFEFFHVKPLPELTPEQQQEMLRKIALLENNNDFIENYLNRLKSQLEALYHFTGGNPRLTVMLYDLIANQNIRDVKEELDSLLDKLTPFYQDRMKDISGEQAPKLLEKMALMAEGCTPTELARESRMDNKIVSALLTRLERSGYVRREPRRNKRTVYIIPERFFRIWHQMNHSRSARGRIQYLLEFFTSWYATPEERDRVWEKLTDHFRKVLIENEEERIDELSEYMQYIEDISEGDEKYKRLFDRLYKIHLINGFEAIQNEFENLDMEYQNDGHYFLNKGIFLTTKTRKKQEAWHAFQIADQLMPDNILIMLNQAFLLNHLKRHDEERILLKKAFELSNPKKYVTSDCPEISDMLIEIFQNQEDPQFLRIVPYLFQKYGGDNESINKIIEIVQTSNSSIKKQIGITTLGTAKSERSVPVILHFLKDEANNVRGSAANALGRIGSDLAVHDLIDCLKDRAKDVRISSLIALGKIALKKPIPHLDRVIQSLIEIKTDETLYSLVKALRDLLDSTFRSGDLEMIKASIENAKKGFKNGEEIFKPYTVALNYIKSNQDPAIMERQHPEMREAAQLLVNSFASGDQGTPMHRGTI